MRKKSWKSQIFLVFRSTCTTFAVVDALQPNEISHVHGQRCLYVPAKPQQSSESPPLLVLIGGMAQSIAAYEPHLPALSRNGRSVLVYEGLGQGPVSNQHDLTDVSLPAQAQQLWKVVDSFQESSSLNDESDSGTETGMIDIAGFSLGGRVALAAACQSPERVRKLHLTGVGTDRSARARVAMQAWKDTVQQDHLGDGPRSRLRAFAWQVLLTTYNPSFLEQQGQERLELWIQHICSNNHSAGIRALLDQAEVTDQNDNFHVRSMAKRLQSIDRPTFQGRLCVGELDEMAPVENAKELAELLNLESPTILEGCGHAVTTEAPREWRNDVLQFLSDD